MASNQEWGGRALFSGETFDSGSEYGGVGGLIQPPPHDPRDEAKEQLMLIYNSHPGGQTPDGRVTSPDPDDVIPETQLMRGYLD